jgi:hypothetical protein
MFRSVTVANGRVRKGPVAAVTFSARLLRMWSVMGSLLVYQSMSDLTEVMAPGQSFGD